MKFHFISTNIKIQLTITMKITMKIMYIKSIFDIQPKLSIKFIIISLKSSFLWVQRYFTFHSPKYLNIPKET